MRRENTLALIACAAGKHVKFDPTNKLQRWLIENDYVTEELYIFDMGVLASQVVDTILETATAPMTGRRIVVITEKGREYLAKNQERFARRGLVE